MKLVFAFVLTLLVSCSSTYKAPKVDDFIQEWARDYEVRDQKLVENYKTYLHAVAQIFHNESHDESFDGYLSSVKNAHQLMTHTEFMLPQRYKMEYRGRNRRSIPKYQTYKLIKITELKTKLDQEREEKFIAPLGTEALNQIRTLYKTKLGSSVEFPL